MAPPGHTARFVLAELLHHGHTPVAVGRDESKLAAAIAGHGPLVETRIASLDSPDSLDRALAGTEAVINCAGPFLDTAQPLIEAALRGGLHYFDVTAEQASALSTFDLFDAPARERGVFVVPAAGFYGGLGDLLATAAMGDWTQADRIDIAIALPTGGRRAAHARPESETPRRDLSFRRKAATAPAVRADAVELSRTIWHARRHRGSAHGDDSDGSPSACTRNTQLYKPNSASRPSRSGNAWARRNGRTGTLGPDVRYRSSRSQWQRTTPHFVERPRHLCDHRTDRRRIGRTYLHRRARGRRLCTRSARGCSGSSTTPCALS